MDTDRELKRLNFDDLLRLNHRDVANYEFNEYRANGYRHPPIEGYCIECERNGYNTVADEPGFTLKNISHGAHTADFLAALRVPEDITGWHEEPILFVYETPSSDYGIYEPVQYQEVTKRPTKDWYWIHGDQDVMRFPENFKGKAYGEFVLSAICTFRLKNAYMTNLVKCGLNSDDGRKFRGLGYFQTKCIETCIDQYLQREITIFKPRVIFAVGARVYEWVEWTLGDNIHNVPVHQLPHPARGRQGFKDSYFRVLYFWLILLALHRADVIPISEAEDLGRTFIRNYEEP